MTNEEQKVKISTESCISEKTVLPVVYFLGIKVKRYRIVKDNYRGYECQKWKLWFPFWVQINYVNTQRTIEEAIKYIEDYANKGNIVLSS